MPTPLRYGVLRKEPGPLDKAEAAPMPPGSISGHGSPARFPISRAGSVRSLPVGDAAGSLSFGWA